MADGKSALANLGFSKFPVGTLEEIQEAGLDPVKVSCCAKPIDGQVRGCAMEGLCRFDRKNMGGFKGQGPHYVGYRVMDPATGDLGTNQGSHLCFAWIHGFQKRADFGAAARRESNGARGEVIRIIAQEGEEIPGGVRHNLPINNKGEVVNVMPEMVENLKRSDIKFSLLPNEITTGRQDFVVKEIVPRFKRLNEVGGESFAQRISMLDWETDLEARERIDYAASPVRSAHPAPAAEPVKRGPGRPPKVREGDEGP